MTNGGLTSEPEIAGLEFYGHAGLILCRRNVEQKGKEREGRLGRKENDIVWIRRTGGKAWMWSWANLVMTSDCNLGGHFGTVSVSV